MAKMIYPENWIEPEPPELIVLTQAQRDQGKAMIENYINGLGEGISYNELLKVAQNWIRNNTNKHIHDSIILEIIDEIYTEWKDTWTFLDAEE